MSALHAGATSFQPSTRTSTSPVRPPLDRVDGAGAAAFYPLHCLPFLPCDHGDSDAVLDSDVVKFACDDVSALLRMPYAHFLSLVVFHKGVRTLVDTFLQHRRRSYETIVGGERREEPRGLRSLSRLMLLTLHRLVGGEHEQMVTAAQASGVSAFGEHASLGDLLYSEWVLDVPKLFDIAALFGRSARSIVSSLLHNLFTLQPAYFSDIAEALPVVSQTLQEVSKKVAASKSDAASAEDAGLVDLHSYLGDISVTLVELFSCYPDAAYCLMPSAAASETAKKTGLLGAEILAKGSLLSELKAVFEVTLPNLHDLLEASGFCAAEILRRRSGLIRSQLLRLFHVVLCHCYFLPLGVSVRDFVYPGTATSDSSKGPSHAVSRVQVHPDAVSTAAVELLEAFEDSAVVDASRRTSLIVQYAKKHHLLHHVRQLQLDSSLCSVHAPRLSALENRIQAVVNAPTRVGNAMRPLQSLSRNVSGVSPADVAEMVAQVKEFMPDYSAGYLAKCLQLTKYSVEQTVHRLLESTMPSPSDIDIALAEAERMAPPPSSRVVAPARRSLGGRFHHGTSPDDEEEDDFLSTLAQGNQDAEFKRAQLIRLASFNEYDDEYDDTFDEHGFNVDSTDLDGGDGNDGVGSGGGGLSLLEEDEQDEDDLMRPNVNHLQPLPRRSRRSGRGGRRGTAARPSTSSGAGGAGAGAGARRDGHGSTAAASRSAGGGKPKAPPDARRKGVQKASRSNHSRRRGASRKLRGGMGSM